MVRFPLGPALPVDPDVFVDNPNHPAIHFHPVLVVNVGIGVSRMRIIGTETLMESTRDDVPIERRSRTPDWIQGLQRRCTRQMSGRVIAKPSHTESSFLVRERRNWEQTF